jgi:ectoine hydroxylase-related dioxygenase (phytanoyl-CoA dioxygenase family)
MFDDDGFAIVQELLSRDECEALAQAVSIKAAGAGSRNLLDLEIVASTAERLRNHQAIAGFLGDDYQVVQCTLFAKKAYTNWSVAPHQDLSIPVRKRTDLPGWSGWSKKEGVWFVQPPAEVLEQLVAVRLQLDENSSETGPLEVMPGTHRNGRLTGVDIAERASRERFKCLVPQGGAVVMRPLLIHSSGKARASGNRRVLHYLYGPALPSGLDWGWPPSGFAVGSIKSLELLSATQSRHHWADI